MAPNAGGEVGWKLKIGAAAAAALLWLVLPQLVAGGFHAMIAQSGYTMPCSLHYFWVKPAWLRWGGGGKPRCTQLSENRNANANGNETD